MFTHRTKQVLIVASAIAFVLIAIYYAVVAVGDDSSTANGALIGAQVETGTPIKTAPTTITLIVSGGRSDVTYNDGHKIVQTSGPFSITVPLQSGRNYSIATFNAKSINSTCTIKIGSKQAITNNAAGQGNTAGCVLTQEKNSHTWMASAW